MVAMAIIENLAKVGLSYGEMVSDEEVERTKALWEDAYDEPYDMAGSEIDAGAVSTGCTKVCNLGFLWRYIGDHSRYQLPLNVVIMKHFD
jgi:hypothetical protein